MLEAPIPSQNESRANQAFDALLMALSRPGDVQVLPVAGEQTIVEALLDRECRVYCADPMLMPGVLATGAMIAEADAADHVFLGNTIDPATLAQIRAGSDLYPDDGATVIVRAALGSGPRLRLSGPGIEHTKEVSLGGLPSGFGLSPDRLAALNPRLILAQLDAFGGPMRGPKSDHLGYDDLAQAATGVMVRFGGGMDTPEEHAHFGTIDVLTGFCACVALGGALLRLHETGKGGVARASLAAAGNLIQAQFMHDYDGRKPFDEPSGREALGWGPFYPSEPE